MKLYLKTSTGDQPGLFDKIISPDAGDGQSGKALAPLVAAAERRVMMLSLWQPWASFCVLRNPLDGLAEKQVETRHWTTDYRGLLAIHATKTLTPDAKFMIETESVFRDTLRSHIGDYGNDMRELAARLVFGAIVGVAEFCGVQEFETAEDGASWVGKHYPAREKYFGNYGGGRFGWMLRNPVRFSEPIPCRGLQKFGKTPTPEIRLEILRRLDEMPAGATVI